MRKLLSKLNNKHFLSLAGNGSVAFFGVLTFSILYKCLPIEDAGSWAFFLTILSLCDALRNGFLGTGVVKFYAGTEKARGDEVLGSVWVLAIALTMSILLLDLGCFYILPYVQNEGVTTAIKWVGVTFVSSLPFSIIYSKLQAEENYLSLLRLRLVNSGSTLLVFIILAVMGRLTLESALLYNVLTNCLTSLTGLLWKLGKIQTIAHRSKAAMLELTHFGKYSLATTFSSNLLGSVDSVIINFVLGPAALAIYNIPMKLMQFIEIPLSSFVATGMSGMAVAYNQKNMGHVSYILRKYAGMLSMAFIPVAILGFCFANTATYLIVLGSHKYAGVAGAEAANIFRMYMVFCLLSPIDRFNGVTLDIIHQPKINFYKVLIMLTVNIAGDFAGIAIFKGLYGIVVAAFVTHIAGIVYGYYQLNKYLPVTVPGIFYTGYTEMKLFTMKLLKIAPKD